MTVMYRISKIITILLVLVSFACHKRPQGWPDYVTSSMWLYETAREVRYSTVYGTYQMNYKATACFPAEQFLGAMVAEMSEKGWKRLDFDSLDPKNKLNHARGTGLWSHWQEPSSEDNVYQWIEDWEDHSGNVIRYGLRYMTKEDHITSQECNLRVTSIYVPSTSRATLPATSPVIR